MTASPDAPDGIRRCHRCTLPVDPAIVHGHLSADDRGLCDFCRTYDERFGDAGVPADGRERLDAQIAWARKRGRGGDFDALVAVSGGKDSLAVLDYLRREYPDLRILAATIDNGFHNPAAMEACVAVTRDLGVTHRVWRPPHMAEMARVFLERTGHFCAPCQATMLNMLDRLTREHRIPMVVLGTSRRYDGAHPEAANPWTPPFFDAVVRRTPGADALRQDICDRGLLFRFGARVLAGRVRTLLLPDYLDWDKTANRQALGEKYGITIGGEHADCFGAPVADWLYKRRCGFGQKAASLAAAVRNRQVDREEALRTLAGLDELGARFPAEEAAEFLARIGLDVAGVEACSTRRPQPYFDAMFRTVGLARELMGFSIT